MTTLGVRINNCLRVAVVASICLIIYAGPASLIGLERIFEDDMFGGTSGAETVGWVAFIWLFSIPLIWALVKWDDQPSASMIGLGIFLMLTLMMWMMFRSLGAALLSLALAAPFMIWNSEKAWETTFFVAACILAFIVCIAIPALGIAFQWSRQRN